MVDDCIQCGLCCSTCLIEAAGFTSFTSLLVDDGEKDDAWTCVNCWKCQEICPQHLDLMNIKYRLQREQTPPPGIIMGVENIRECGFCLPLEIGINETRILNGLEALVLPDKKTINFLLEK